MKVSQELFDQANDLLGLSATCCGLECKNCPFDSNDYCGIVVIRNIMRKLAGADSHTQSMTDKQLIDFIRRNPSKP